MRKDDSHYSGKHEAGALVNEDAAELIRSIIDGNRISCAMSHQLASEAGISPAEFGRTLDLMEIRISSCILGLFGRREESSKHSKDSDAPAPELRDLLQQYSDAGEISCADIWKAARHMNVSRKRAALECEDLELKIVDCQLGEF